MCQTLEMLIYQWKLVPGSRLLVQPGDTSKHIFTALSPECQDTGEHRAITQPSCSGAGESSWRKGSPLNLVLRNVQVKKRKDFLGSGNSMCKGPEALKSTDL